MKDLEKLKEQAKEKFLKNETGYNYGHLEGFNEGWDACIKAITIIVSEMVIKDNEADAIP